MKKYLVLIFFCFSSLSFAQGADPAAMYTPWSDTFGSSAPVNSMSSALSTLNAWVGNLPSCGLVDTGWVGGGWTYQCVGASGYNYSNMSILVTCASGVTQLLQVVGSGVGNVATGGCQYAINAQATLASNDGSVDCYSYVNDPTSTHYCTSIYVSTGAPGTSGDSAGDGAVSSATGTQTSSSGSGSSSSSSGTSGSAGSPGSSGSGSSGSSDSGSSGSSSGSSGSDSGSGGSSSSGSSSSGSSGSSSSGSSSGSSGSTGGSSGSSSGGSGSGTGSGSSGSGSSSGSSSTPPPTPTPVCGVPGSGDCAVKVDESGTPAAGSGSALFNGLNQAYSDFSTQQTTNLNSISGFFADTSVGGWVPSLPSGSCTEVSFSLPISGGSATTSICGYLPMISSMFDALWAVFFGFAIIGLVSEASKKG